jgi:putative transposase
MLPITDGGAQMLGLMLEAFVDAEATAMIGGQRQQRTEERGTRRNGTRLKTVSTTSSDLAVKIPKLRTR